MRARIREYTRVCQRTLRPHKSHNRIINCTYTLLKTVGTRWRIEVNVGVASRTQDPALHTYVTEDVRTYL